MSMPALVIIIFFVIILFSSLKILREYLKAYSEEPITADDEVIVTGIDKMVLKVRKK